MFLASADGSLWSISGAGTLNATSGGNVTLTASDQPGWVTVSVSAQGCVGTSTTFDVIAPYNLYWMAVNGTKHTKGLADIGMQANVYLMPDSVSFSQLYYLERDASASASGIYLCYNGESHHPNPAPLPAGQTVVGYGTPVALDTIEQGACGGVDQHGNGSLNFAIPQVYSVGAGGTQVELAIVQHQATASGGSLTIQKGDASRSTTVDSNTTSY